MAHIYNNLTELIGNTPLVRIEKIAMAHGAEAEILAKVEYFNPGGSSKDRVALNMIEDADGMVDAFVAGAGTGGTISGVGRALKAKNPNIKIIAVEPATNPVLSGGKAGPHKIQGIGANFIPENFDRSVVDEIFLVPNEDALQTGRELSQYEGMIVGISSGAAVYAAIELAKRPEFKGKRIIALLPDTGERYLSTELYI